MQSGMFLRSRDKGEGLTALLPSFFDLLLIGSLGIVLIQDNFLKGIFFVFYPIFLYIISTFLEPKRKFVSVPLSLFLLWSFISMFPHNFVDFCHRPTSILNYYYNVSIMFEGFIFVLCGFMLLRLSITHSKNLKWIFIVAPLLFFQRMYENYVCLRTDSHGGRVTILAAILISIIIYLLLNRRYVSGILLIILGLILSVINWDFLLLKFNCRPHVWWQMIKQMMATPLFGEGFNRTLFPDNMIYAYQINGIEYGWVYRHNDFLSIGAYLGIPALVLISSFVVRTIKQIGRRIYLIPFLAVVLTCMFQATMFTPEKAVIAILLTGLAIKETI